MVGGREPTIHLPSWRQEFGWVLPGSADNIADLNTVTSHHVSVLTGDDILHQFWELEARQWPITLLL